MTAAFFGVDKLNDNANVDDQEYEKRQSVHEYDVAVAAKNLIKYGMYTEFSHARLIVVARGGVQSNRLDFEPSGQIVHSAEQKYARYGHERVLHRTNHVHFERKCYVNPTVDRHGARQVDGKQLESNKYRMYDAINGTDKVLVRVEALIVGARRVDVQFEKIIRQQIAQRVEDYEID